VQNIKDLLDGGIQKENKVYTKNFVSLNEASSNWPDRIRKGY
jgi:hypothetical protein